VMAVSIREFGLYVLFEVFNVLKMAYWKWSCVYLFVCHLIWDLGFLFSVYSSFLNCTYIDLFHCF
jgi:hypothetical protein